MLVTRHLSLLFRPRTPFPPAAQIRVHKSWLTRVATGDNAAIRSIRHRGLKRLYESGEARGVPAALAGKIADILLAIDGAAEPQDVGLFPGWKLHPLKAGLKGFWSVTATGNWRVIFRFQEGDAFDLDLVDYH